MSKEAQASSRKQLLELLRRSHARGTGSDCDILLTEIDHLSAELAGLRQWKEWAEPQLANPPQITAGVHKCEIEPRLIKGLECCLSKTSPTSDVYRILAEILKGLNATPSDPDTKIDKLSRSAREWLAKMRHDTEGHAAEVLQHIEGKDEELCVLRSALEKIASDDPQWEGYQGPWQDVAAIALGRKIQST